MSVSLFPFEHSTLLLLRSLEDEADLLEVHGGALPVVEVVLEVAVTDPELELLQERRVLHQVQRVEHVEVALIHQCIRDQF